MQHKYIINGFFLTQGVAGLGRTGREIITELDKLAAGIDIVICVPGGCADCVPDVTNMKIVEIGQTDTPRWTTNVLREYARRTGRRVLNITTQYSTVPGSVVTIADVRYMEKGPDGRFYDSPRFRAVCILQTVIGLLNARRVVTISEFSKRRLKKYFRVPDKKIKVINCGWQHIERVEEDDRIFDRYPQLKGGEYFFTVGTLAPHKNHAWIKAVSQKNPDRTFVICGGVDAAIWSEGLPKDSTDNLLFTGYLTDGEMKSLMSRARAFLFPSLYEGFGIPPLEALAVGTDCIVSDIPVHREILGDAVHYIDPRDTYADLESLLNEELKVSKETVLSKYSWEKAARQWLELIQEQI